MINESALLLLSRSTGSGLLCCFEKWLNIVNMLCSFWWDHHRSGLADWSNDCWSYGQVWPLKKSMDDVAGDEVDSLRFHFKVHNYSHTILLHHSQAPERPIQFSGGIISRWGWAGRWNEAMKEVYVTFEVMNWIIHFLLYREFLRRWLKTRRQR